MAFTKEIKRKPELSEVSLARDHWLSWNIDQYSEHDTFLDYRFGSLAADRLVDALLAEGADLRDIEQTICAALKRELQDRTSQESSTRENYIHQALK